MPDWIYNDLRVTGPSEEVKRFRNSVIKKKENKLLFSLEKLFPTPKDFDKEGIEESVLRKRYNAPDWYIWRIQNWGTKTPLTPCRINELDNGLYFSFDTAWAPINSWIVHIASKFPELTFRNAWLYEGLGGGDFSVWVEDGEVQDDEEELNDHEWKMRFNDDYAKEYKFIIEGNYDEVLENYKDDNPEYNDLEIFFVKRIKDEDLPLFIDRDWERGDSEELFMSRLKGDENNA